MSISTFALVAVLVPTTLIAQRSTIPIIDVPEPTVRTGERVGAVLGIRQSTDGKVLVNDALRRQMLLFDTTLAHRVVVMDSVPGTSTSYGPIPTALIPFAGDSSIFTDWNSRTLVVLSGHGSVARTIALPRPQDLVSLNGAPSGFDANGRLLFQALREETHSSQTDPAAFKTLDASDSLVIVRADFDARRVDTVARIARPVMKLTTQKTTVGTVTTIFAADPLQAVDDWAVLSNGALVIVRGHDYHLDWIDVEGSMHSSPKLPFDWVRLSDSEKRRLSDSLRLAQDSMVVKGYPPAEMMLQGPMPCGAPDAGRGGDAGDGGGRRGGRGGGGGNAPPPSAAANGCWAHLRAPIAPFGAAMWSNPPMPPLADLTRYNPLPDYAPPIRANTTMPDLDGNLWILPRASTLSKKGELVYDVVNTKGELFERVRVPFGRAIIGFAKGGVVYLAFGDIKSGYYVERTRLPSAKR